MVENISIDREKKHANIWVTFIRILISNFLDFYTWNLLPTLLLPEAEPPVNPIKYGPIQRKFQCF